MGRNIKNKISQKNLTQCRESGQQEKPQHVCGCPKNRAALPGCFAFYTHETACLQRDLFNATCADHTLITTQAEL